MSSNNSSSSKKVALVTGANKGIGFAVARGLGKLGFIVLIGARSVSNGEKSAQELRDEGIDARHLLLDVTSPSSVNDAAKIVEKEFGVLDVLVNNAGVALDKDKPSNIDLELFRQTYEVNVFGLFSVTKAFIPLLKLSEAGRIVNVTSSLGSLTTTTDPNYPFYKNNAVAYMSSKTTINALTVIFSKELQADTKIKVNSADPGYCATDLTQHRGHRTTEQGSAIIIKLATLPEDGATGGYFNDKGPVPW